MNGIVTLNSPRRKHPMISLIITTAPGREENLNACLQSIAHQTIQPIDVIVTDDGETGGKVVEQWTSSLPSTTFLDPTIAAFLAPEIGLSPTQVRSIWCLLMEIFC